MFKREIKGFIAGIIVASILLLSPLTKAQEIRRTVEVFFNRVNLKVNGQKVDSDNILYNGTTYIPLRAVAEIIDLEVGWDGNTNTAHLTEKVKTPMIDKNTMNILHNGKLVNIDNIFYEGNTYVKINSMADIFNQQTEIDVTASTIYLDDKGTPKLTGFYPNNMQEDYYPRFGYINLVFSDDMKNNVDKSKINLINKNGSMVGIKEVVPGITAKNNMLIVLNDVLKLDTEYLLNIPINTFESIDGKKYTREIKVSFKSAHTVIEGKLIIGTNSVKNYRVYIDTENMRYEAQIYSDYGFMFTNIPGGEHTIVVRDESGSIYEQKIRIEQGIVNKLQINPTFIK